MSTRLCLASSALVLVLVNVACGSSPAAPAGAPGTTAATPGGAIEHVDGSKAKKLVAGGAKLVDVRGADEYGAKHIEGADNAPVETIEDRDIGPKDATYVLYCSSGARSERAATTLRSKGYTKVYVLGGMSNWDK
jgi:rhodanese-related sulfurtransferase